MQMTLFERPYKQEDIVLTPDWCAKDMVKYFNPTGKILDPCSGDGVFLKHLPDAEWCEIRKGKDFFDYNKKVDWIISNPPYSGFFDWIYHSMSLADNFVYLIPANKPFISNRLIMILANWGEIKHIRFYGTGNNLGFPVGFAIGAFHFQKGNKGTTYSYYTASRDASGILNDEIK